jgi:hypothetical protein
MRQCPVCRTTYLDDSLRFCLADGNPLVDVAGEQPTVARAVGTDETIAMPTVRGGQVRVDIPQPTAGPGPHQYAETRVPGPSNIIYKVVIALLLVGLLVVVAGAAGLFIYFRAGGWAGGEPRNDNRPVTPQQSPEKTDNKDQDELRDQIANLERMLNEQKKSKQPAKLPDIPSTSAMTRTATVDSPNDGFLALRTLPNSELGERILKIPHGAVVSVGECGPVVTPVKRSGRWCQASYNGYRGWVFDGFLIY